MKCAPDVWSLLYTIRANPSVRFAPRTEGLAQKVYISPPPEIKKKKSLNQLCRAMPIEAIARRSKATKISVVCQAHASVTDHIHLANPNMDWLVKGALYSNGARHWHAINTVVTLSDKNALKSTDHKVCSLTK